MTKKTVTFVDEPIAIEADPTLFPPLDDDGTPTVHELMARLRAEKEQAGRVEDAFQPYDAVELAVPVSHCPTGGPGGGG